MTWQLVQIHRLFRTPSCDIVDTQGRRENVYQPMSAKRANVSRHATFDRPAHDNARMCVSQRFGIHVDAGNLLAELSRALFRLLGNPDPPAC